MNKNKLSLRILKLVFELARDVVWVVRRHEEAGALQREDDEVVVEAVRREDAHDGALRNAGLVSQPVGEQLGLAAQGASPVRRVSSSFGA